jgi:hypothetical protein
MKLMKIIIMALGLLMASLSNGQSNSAPEKELTQPSALTVANHLRTHYDITHAAYLTQMAWQLSHSFASSDQLIQQWQQALDTQVTPQQQYSRINTHALMAQTLIQYSHGMTLNRWRTVDLQPKPILPELVEGLTPDQAFQVWLNLPYFWQMILNNQGEEDIQWLTFPTEPQTMGSKSDEAIAPHHAVLNWLAQDETDLVSSLADSDSQVSYYDNLATALVRQHLHKNQQNLLAYAYDWVEIYQLIELSPMLLTAEEQQNLLAVINHTQMFWDENQNQVNEIDKNLHPIIKLLLAELPRKFKNPDHINTALNQQFLMIALDISDINSYLNHPIRKNIQENLEVCLNLSVSQAPDPRVPIASNQFESCFQDFMNWATTLSTDSTFSGNQVRLDNPASLHRALELPSIQIPNILNTQAIADEACQQQLLPQVNVFEWLLATESLTWFHDRWPGIFAAVDKSTEFSQLMTMGRNIHKYPPCFKQSEVLQNQYQNLKTKWERLKLEINNQINLYAKEQLHEHTDVNLFGSMDQKTNYIPEDLVIGPCQVSKSCGAFIELTPNLELMNLFPNHIKLASQFGLGSLSICYDDVQWRNRKTAPTHLDNNKISNFEGQLSIQLNGMFDDKKVFTKELISEQRHVYLFGENNQETLDLSCPLSIIGKQINTTLDRGTFGLLPNRLTFLTAQKADVNKVIRNNWDAWLAAIKTDQIDLNYFDDMKGIKTQLNDAFLQHVNRLQQQIYRKLITSNPARINDSALSKATFEYLNQRKLLAYFVSGLFPQTYHGHSKIRSGLTGVNQLIGADFFKSSFDNQINVIDMMNLGDEIFEKHEPVWTHNNQLDNAATTGFIDATMNELADIVNN